MISHKAAQKAIACFHTSSVLLVGLITGAVANPKCRFDLRRLTLDCRAHGLKTVPSEEFHTNTLEIDLSYNSISMVSHLTFANVTRLRSLDMSHNCIETIDSDAFAGLGNLITLNLSKNEFALDPDVLSPELFAPLSSLKVLKVDRLKNGGYSSWRGIDSSFAKLKNLSTLFVDFPMDFAFESGFELLTQLSTISTSGIFWGRGECDIRTLRNSTFKGLRHCPVKVLSLVFCNISDIELNAFGSLKSLDYLDLSWNTNLGVRAVLKSVYGLQWRNLNEIRSVFVNNDTCLSTNNFILEEQDFKFLRNVCVKSLDFSVNFLSAIQTSLRPVFRLDCLERLNVSFHTFRCLPLEFLLPFSGAQRLTNVDFSYGFGTPSYGSGSAQSSVLRQLSPLKSISRQMKYNLSYPIIPLPPKISSINVSGIAFWLYVDNLSFVNGSNLKTLDISYNNIDNCDHLRLSGVENVIYLGLSQIKCRDIPPEFFLSMRKVTHLILSDSADLNTATLPLALLDILEEVDLSGCALTNLHPRLFENNRWLRSIYLANNRFYRIPLAISGLAYLELLDLSKNAFTYLLPDEMRLLDTWMIGAHGNVSFLLRLGQNPFQCTCNTVLFIRWILKRKDFLDQQGNYTCFLSDGSTISVFRFGQGLADFEVRCVSRTYLTISVIGSLIFILLVLFFAAIYRYRLNLKYWLYANLKPPENMFVNRIHQFDAFVAYTDTEYEWVFRKLRPKLESGDNPVRLCLHNRDFIPGKPIHENIVENMRKSKKIVLIISLDFLESNYGPLEIEYAGMKCVEEGRDDIVVCVRMGQIPLRQMPRALRNLWHKITFLDWNPLSEGTFWRNLQSALDCPRPNSL